MLTLLPLAGCAPTDTAPAGPDAAILEPEVDARPRQPDDVGLDAGAEVHRPPLPRTSAGARPARWVSLDARAPDGVVVADDEYPLASGWYVGAHSAAGVALHLFFARFDAETRTWGQTSGAFPTDIDGKTYCVPGPQQGLRPASEGGPEHEGTRFWRLEPGFAALDWAASEGLEGAEIEEAWSAAVAADLPVIEAAFRVDGAYLPYDPLAAADFGADGVDANSNTYVAFALAVLGVEGQIRIPDDPEPFEHSLGTYVAFRPPGGDGRVFLCGWRETDSCEYAVFPELPSAH